MKAKILLGALAFYLTVALAHVGINIGFAEFARDIKVFLGLERATLRIGFLPVT